MISFPIYSSDTDDMLILLKNNSSHFLNQYLLSTNHRKASPGRENSMCKGPVIGNVFQFRENKENRSIVIETQWVRKRQAQEEVGETAGGSDPVGVRNLQS